MDFLFINGLFSSLAVLVEILSVCVDVLLRKAFSLGVLADVSTILATLLASGVLITWFWKTYYRRNPFELDQCVFSKTNWTGPVYFSIRLQNRLDADIEVYNADLLGDVKYEVTQLSGKLDKGGATRPYVASAKLDGTKTAKAHGEVGFTFMFNTRAEGEKAYEKAKLLLVRTCRGPFTIKPDFTIWKTKGGMVEYHAETNWKFCHYWNLLKYFCWRFGPVKYRKHFYQRDEI